jgi:hypothetical protein
VCSSDLASQMYRFRFPLRNDPKAGGVVRQT